MEQAIIDQLIALATSYYGVPAGVAGMLLGLFGRRAIAWIRPWVVKTPTKVDDMILSGLEALLSAKEGGLSKVTVRELEAIMTTRQIIELVKVRKEKLNAAKV